MDNFSYLSNTDPATVDELFKQYKQDPESVDASWRDFFKGFEFAQTNYAIKSDDDAASSNTNSSFDEKEFYVANLIQAYRQRGHLFTKTNPVRKRRKYFPTLDIENFDLSKADLEHTFKAGNKLGLGPTKLKDIIAHLESTYCESVGVEYIYMRHPEVVSWLQTKMEKVKNRKMFTKAQKLAIYQEVMQAVNFEQFIHKKFIGEKRFSLEGSEALIPALWAIAIKGHEMGAREFIIGMAHRGRLNVLSNILGKPYADIFREFVGEDYVGNIALGDVKYHLGYGRDIEVKKGGSARINLVPNPSHLETVLPIMEGLCRSKIDNQHESNYDRIVPIAIHGDAAIAGQGVVYETVQMSQLEGYKTGGTIHIAINNQVGFTTGYLEGRSSTYCTDVAKVTRSPVFHVNGDDIEAMVYTAQLAMEFLYKYKTDVFIDLLSYRKFGHNEGDEPRFTQPLLYKEIAKHPDPKTIYGNQLIAEGTCTQAELDALNKDFNDGLERCLAVSREDHKLNIRQFLPKTWAGFKYPTSEDFIAPVKTSIPKEKIIEIGETINSLPEDKAFFKKAHKIIGDRKKMLTNNNLDWGTTELLAYGTLIDEGHKVRLSGQDCVRGTFAHRHAEFSIEDSPRRYNVFDSLNAKGKFEVYNSNLSEYGVMGFEYGYALGNPKGLTIWEAQFGDFYNVAQVIIDQYISSAEEKWGLMNGLVLYLPHGFEGQGPEHSSARIERFLSLSANNNMQIMNFTTPANLFHALRRQVKFDFRVPMVIFTPKSLLRHPKCISTVADLSEGKFLEVIDDDNAISDKVLRVVFCSGKVYYDLLAEKEKFDAKDVALIRMEQLHPFPKGAIQEILAKYKNALLHLWVQEEPENQGPWKYINQNFPIELIPVARRASGSPATGLKKLHKAGQDEIVAKVFRRCTCDHKLKYCGLQCVQGKSRNEVLKQHHYFQSDARFSI